MTMEAKIILLSLIFRSLNLEKCVSIPKPETLIGTQDVHLPEPLISNLPI